MAWCEKCVDFHFGPHDCPCGASLTEREKEVMRLIAEGRNNESIADKLYLSKHTIRDHLKNLYIKFDIDGTKYDKRLKLALLGQELREVKYENDHRAT